MTKDEIQALAYKTKVRPMLQDGRWGITNMELFVDLVIKEEREACAKLCESLFDADDDSCSKAATCAAAIRARSHVQQEPQVKD